MLKSFLTLLSLMILAVSGHLFQPHSHSDGENVGLQKLAHEFVKSSIMEIVEENNGKIFKEIEKYNQKIINLESQFNR